MSSAPRPALPFSFTREPEKEDRAMWREMEMREKEGGREGGCTSTGNLIMHGRAAGAKKERKRDGWRGKEERRRPTYAKGRGAGGEEGKWEGQRR